jgi:hypothetical protein
MSFIDFVLNPLWKAVARTFPPMRTCFDNLQANRKQYEQMAQRIGMHAAIIAVHLSKFSQFLCLQSFCPSTDIVVHVLIVSNLLMH